MGVIEGGEVGSSGDEGGGTCHNDKPGQSKDKVLKMGIQNGGDAGRVKRGDQAGPATMTSRAGFFFLCCLCYLLLVPWES